QLGRCGRQRTAASGISPGTKKIFCKNVFHTKATPFIGQNHFWTGFCQRGMIKFSKWKVPPTGGSSAPVTYNAARFALDIGGGEATRACARSTPAILTASILPR